VPRVTRPRAALGVGALLFLAVGVLAFRPVDTSALASRPHAATSYGEAVERLRALEALDGPDINPLCRSQAKLHGHKTARAIVLIHGFTSCPYMWHELADDLYSLGYNVLIGRVPHHGLQDRLNDDIANLKADELVHVCDRLVDITEGLGDAVAVAGISAGGVMAAWIAEQRADVDQVVIVNPNFTAPNFNLLASPVVNILLTVPNQFLWWDEKTKERVPGPTYAYPRYSTHALGEIYRLGQAVETKSRVKPMARRVVVMTVQADPAVSNDFTDGVLRNWRSAGLKDLVTYRWPPSVISFHDILTPEQPYQRTALVYPKLLELIGA
jgi:esterase/lipase